jgi:hypothetical protein
LAWPFNARRDPLRRLDRNGLRQFLRLGPLRESRGQQAVGEGRLDLCLVNILRHLERALERAVTTFGRATIAEWLRLRDRRSRLVSTFRRSSDRFLLAQSCSYPTNLSALGVAKATEGFVRANSRALSCLDVRPLIKGYFSALRWSWVRSCLRPLTRRIESAGPDVVR